jgi:UDPglucose 6-dehydrogenase
VARRRASDISPVVGNPDGWLSATNCEELPNRILSPLHNVERAMSIPNHRRRIGILGLGYVGKSVFELLSPTSELVVWDRADGSAYPSDDLASCDFVVICVDSPTGQDGRTDVSSVNEAVTSVPCSRILLKSTVPPGTTARLSAETGKSICFWPEYVGESSYFNPYFATKIAEVPFLIIGGESDARQWCIDALLPILGPTKSYFQCSAIEAELIKYAENAYFATKITFVNEYRRVCEAFEADWHTVREGWLLDPRVERMHTAAFSQAPGFGGKCLPKDLNAIVNSSLDQGYEPALLREVLASNERFQSRAEPITTCGRCGHLDSDERCQTCGRDVL